jgi:hypothetical protein
MTYWNKLRWVIQNWKRGMLSRGLSILHDNSHPHANYKVVALQHPSILFQWCFWNTGLDNGMRDIICMRVMQTLSSANFFWSGLTHLIIQTWHLVSITCFQNWKNICPEDDKVRGAVQCFLNALVMSWYDMGIQ